MEEGSTFTSSRLSSYHLPSSPSIARRRGRSRLALLDIIVQEEGSRKVDGGRLSDVGQETETREGGGSEVASSSQDRWRRALEWIAEEPGREEYGVEEGLAWCYGVEGKGLG